MNKKIKFLGIPIGKEYIRNNVYKKKVLLHEIKFNFNEYHITYRFLGFKYLTKTFCFEGVNYELFKFIKFQKHDKKLAKSLLPVLFDYVKEKLNKEKIDLVGLFPHLGESFLALHYLGEFIKNKNIENPVIITHRKPVINMPKMFFENIQTLQVPNIFYGIHSESVEDTKIDGYRFINTLPVNHFINQELSMYKEDNQHFVQEVTKTMDVLPDKINCSEFPSEVIESARAKMDIVGLKPPFIYICPDAVTTKTLSKEFWDKLPVKIFQINKKFDGGGEVRYVL